MDIKFHLCLQFSLENEHYVVSVKFQNEMRMEASNSFPLNEETKSFQLEFHMHNFNIKYSHHCNHDEKKKSKMVPLSKGPLH